MKALSLRQPWASLIIESGKDIENRDWRCVPSYRGPLLIHAAKGCTEEEWYDADYFCESRSLPMPRPLASLPRGGIIGQVDLIGCTQRHESPWFIGPLGLILANPMPLPFTPYKGQLGLFDIPNEIVEAATFVSPKVLNRHHLPNKGRPLPPNAIYTGRGTPWGNPYSHPRDPDPIGQFAEYIFDNPGLIARIRRELRGKDLVCSCAPRPCHADMLLIIANADTDDVSKIVQTCRNRHLEYCFNGAVPSQERK